MVDSTSAKLIRDSATAIEASFRKSIGTHTTPSATNDYGVPELFESAFEDDHDVAKIPSLHDIASDSLAEYNGRLVRTLCYVVHSDSEIYGGAFRSEGVWQLGRYGMDSTASMPVSDADLVFEERTSLQCRILSLAASNDNLEASVQGLTLQDNAASRTTSFYVKLYNEKEEGLLHACLDIIGILEVSGQDVSLHSIITKNQRLSSMITSAHTLPDMTDVSEVRADLLQKLDAALEGDDLASELLLLCILSGVAMRSPLLVGPFSLNLRGVSTSTTNAIAKIVSDLTPTLSYDMSIDNLNKSQLYPSHDGETYCPGSLQLPSDYTVLLNEAALSEGSLDERGVKNLQTLTETINSQELIFHFPFSEFKIPVDLSFLILSHGKSLLPCTVSLPLKKSSMWNLNTKSSLEQMRHYVARCRLQEVEIAEDVSTEIQEDFVRSRKQGGAFDQTDLSMALALGKEVARSHGRSHMSWEDYQHARALRKRIQSRDTV